MKKFLKKLWIRFFCHNRFQLTGKGLYTCNYIINKYINEETPDDWNETYEELVEKNLKRVEARGILSNFHDSSGKLIRLNKEEKRLFAAQMTLLIILYSSRKEDKEKIYNCIKDDDARETIKNMVEKGIIL